MSIALLVSTKKNENVLTRRKRNEFRHNGYGINYVRLKLRDQSVRRCPALERFARSWSWWRCPETCVSPCLAPSGWLGNRCRAAPLVLCSTKSYWAIRKIKHTTFALSKVDKYLIDRLYSHSSSSQDGPFRSNEMSISWIWRGVAIAIRPPLTWKRGKQRLQNGRIERNCIILLFAKNHKWYCGIRREK